MRRRSLGLLAGAGALALGAADAAAAPLTDGDVALDVFQGTAVGSVRVVGMGGVVTALAEGSAGTLANPAAAAIRATTSTSRWDWDFHLDGVAGRDGGDLDNDGLAADGRQTVATAGLAIYRGRWGVAASTMSSTATIDDGSAMTLDANAVDTRLCVGRRTRGDAVIAGAGLRWTQFDVSNDALGTLLTRAVVGVEAGASWQPRGQDLRVGLAAGTPLVVDKVAPCDAAECGVVVPTRLAVPWRASLGVAYRLAPSRWNTWVDAPYRDERALLLAVEAMVTGGANDAIGIGGFARQEDRRTSGAPSVTVRAGAEHETLPGRLRLRGGTYWEPSRFADGRGRLHATFGVELNVYRFGFFGPRRLRLSATADLARQFSNAGLSVGFWH